MRVLLVAMLAVTPALAQSPPPDCPKAELSLDTGGLPHLAAALHPGGHLRILSIGAAPGVGMPPPETQAAPPQPQAAPHAGQGLAGQLARALELKVHGLTTEVTVKGGLGHEAAELLAVLRSELHGEAPYQLVLWQTGTVDAVQNVPAGDFYQTLMDGAALIAGAGADLVLVDPQYSRFLEANANIEPYEAAMQAAGNLPGATLFHRFDLMRDWVESGAIDLEQTPKEKRREVAQRLHACLAQAMAATLLADIAASE